MNTFFIKTLFVFLLWILIFIFFHNIIEEITTTITDILHRLHFPAFLKEHRKLDPLKSW